MIVGLETVHGEQCLLGSRQPTDVPMLDTGDGLIAVVGPREP